MNIKFKLPFQEIVCGQCTRVLASNFIDEIRTVVAVSTDNFVQSNLQSNQTSNQPRSSSSTLLAEQASTDNTTPGSHTTYQNIATSPLPNPSATDLSSPAVIKSLVHIVQSQQTMVFSLTTLITAKKTNSNSFPAFNLQQFCKSDESINFLHRGNSEPTLKICLKWN